MADIPGDHSEDLASQPGEHCLHWQEGDDDCHKCGLMNWCPDGGLPIALTEAVLEIKLAPVAVCRPGQPWDDARTHYECEIRGHPMYGPVPGGSGAERCLCGEVWS